HFPAPQARVFPPVRSLGSPSPGSPGGRRVQPFRRLRPGPARPRPRRASPPGLARLAAPLVAADSRTMVSPSAGPLTGPTLDLLSRPNCPMCGVPGELRFEGLRDTAGSAPGEWSFRACVRCPALWLDPQPVPPWSPLLYRADYVTHRPPQNLLGA